MTTTYDPTTIVSSLAAFGELPDWLSAGMDPRRVREGLERQVPELLRRALPVAGVHDRPAACQGRRVARAVHPERRRARRRASRGRAGRATSGRPDGEPSDPTDVSVGVAGSVSPGGAVRSRTRGSTCGSRPSTTPCRRCRGWPIRRRRPGCSSRSSGTAGYTDVGDHLLRPRRRAVQAGQPLHRRRRAHLRRRSRSLRCRRTAWSSRPTTGRRARPRGTRWWRCGSTRRRGAMPCGWPNRSATWRTNGSWCKDRSPGIGSSRTWPGWRSPTVTSGSSAGSAQQLAATAQGIAAVHTSGVTYGPTDTIEDELDKVREVVDRLAASVPELAEAAQPLVGCLAGLARETDPDPVVPCHHDFRPAQVLLDGEGVSFVDFDGACMGEPALDLGRFRAKLRDTGISAFGPDAPAPVRRRHRAEPGPARPPLRGVPDRLPAARPGLAGARPAVGDL